MSQENKNLKTETNPGTEDREIIDWVDESRLGWQSGIVPSDDPEARQIEDYDRQNLTLGCLLRIAENLERIADRLDTRS